MSTLCILAICDEDEAFMTRLADILKRRTTFPFRVSVYTNTDSLCRDIVLGKLGFVLLSDAIFERINTHLTNEILEKTIIAVLSSGKYMNSEFNCIWKYQAGEQIRKDILKIYSECNGGEFRDKGNRETQVSVVFSVENERLCDAVAVGVSQYYLLNEKCLYIDTGLFSSLSMEREKDNDLSDLIFFLRSDSGKMLYKLESMVNSIGGVDCVMPVRNFLDVLEVTGEEWLLLIKAVSDIAVYDRLIISLSPAVRGFMDIMNQCDELIIPVTEYGKKEVEHFKTSLYDTSFEDIASKMRILEIYEEKNGFGGVEASKSRISGYVRNQLCNMMT